MFTSTCVYVTDVLSSEEENIVNMCYLKCSLKSLKKNSITCVYDCYGLNNDGDNTTFTSMCFKGLVENKILLKGMILRESQWFEL